MMTVFEVCEWGPAGFPADFGSCVLRYSAMAWLASRTLSNVKSRAMSPRQPEVPNLIIINLLKRSLRVWQSAGDNEKQFYNSRIRTSNQTPLFSMRRYSPQIRPPEMKPLNHRLNPHSP